MTTSSASFVSSVGWVNSSTRLNSSWATCARKTVSTMRRPRTGAVTYACAERMGGMGEVDSASGTSGSGVGVASKSGSPPNAERALLTMEEVVEHAEWRDYRVEKYCAGPVCRLDIYRGSDGELAAFITAVVLPTGRLHIESYKALPKDGGGLLSVTAGMLVFTYALAFGVDRGCADVYGLAIKDAPLQHAKLKRYLKRFGGVEVKKVTDDLQSIPDKLLYGGVGTIIKGNVKKMLRRATDMLARDRVMANVASSTSAAESGANGE